MDNDVFMDIKPPLEEIEALSAQATIPSSELIGDRMQIGRGATGIGADRRGQWWGGDDPSTAPYFVDVNGVAYLRSTDKGAGGSFIFEESGNPIMFLGFEDEQ